MEAVLVATGKVGLGSCRTPFTAVHKPHRLSPSSAAGTRIVCECAPVRGNRKVSLGTLAVASQGLAALAAVAATTVAAPEPGGLGGLLHYFQTGDVDSMSHIQQFILVAGPFGLAPGLVSSPLLLLGIVKEGKVPKEKVLTSTRNALIGWVVLTFALSILEDILR